MSTINGIEGEQYARGTNEYARHRYQYATSSYEADRRMDPQLIIYPKDHNDIITSIKYAKSKRIAVAIRTGGHQYSGASSTSGPNIQLDLKKTFRSKEDLRLYENRGQTFVRASVSFDLETFNEFMAKNNIFVPHGQCSHVHLGGHVQTGGYGQLGRSFGLFGDHVVSLEVINSDGEIKTVNKESDRDLFYAVLGGSPGNFVVITHFTIVVHRDEDYKESRGLKAMYWYNRNTLENLLDILVDMSDDNDFPRNYDYCVSVLSSSCKLLDLFPEADGEMRKSHPELYGEDDVPFWPRLIIVYAQWVPFDANDRCDMEWFDRIRKSSIFNIGVEKKSMSKLTGDWIFRNVREFDHPYIKRTYVTNSNTLGTDGWASWVTGRIDDIVKPRNNRCWLSAQIQPFGGRNSMFSRNKDNGTSYSWRDSTVVCVLDCFYDPSSKKRAEEWQRINDVEGVGPSGKFSKQDRRVLWGSHGNFNLDESWAFYYENRSKYERLCKTKSKVDPDGVFTPNTFCVGSLHVDDKSMSLHQKINGDTRREEFFG